MVRRCQMGNSRYIRVWEYRLNTLLYTTLLVSAVSKSHTNYTHIIHHHHLKTPSTKMHYLTISSLILSSALFSSAAPTSTYERRACSTAYPATIGFPINYSISQDAGATNKHDNLVSFTSVPAGSYGCQLEVNFPAGYPITSSGNSQVYVFAEDGPSKGSQVGTVTFASSPVAPTKYIINSFQCATTMSYRLSIGSQTDAGSVAFAGTQDAGFTMTYNC